MPKISVLLLLILYCSLFFFSGLGSGMCVCASNTIIVDHFDKYKGIAFGILSAGAGLGGLVSPFLLDVLNKTYGWRGTMLIMGGILLHSCVFGAIMWPKDKRMLSTQTISKDNASLTELEIFQKLCTNWRFLVLCVSNVSFCFGCSIFLTHMPEYSRRKLGLNESQMAVLVSSIGAANLVCPLIQGALIDLQYVNSQVVFMTSCTCIGVVVAFLPFAGTYVWMIIFCILFGVMYAASGPASSVITLLYAGKETFASGFGYLLFIGGVGIVLGPPVAGNSHSLSQRYFFVLRFFVDINSL